jgi:hypothetical protein
MIKKIILFLKWIKSKLKEFRFINSAFYWERRYKSGGNSGAGSYNKLAEFKASIINNFIEKEQIFEVIEFGSGDGNQLKYFNISNYTGFDVSSSAINICKQYYKNDLSKSFFHISEYKNQNADLSLSLDVIYHLVEDLAYFKYMTNLFNAANKYVIIYSSNKDDHENNGKSFHVRHRKFSDWVVKNASNFELIKFIPNKYQYNGDDEESSYADFYIYKKR